VYYPWVLLCPLIVNRNLGYIFLGSPITGVVSFILFDSVVDFNDFIQDDFIPEGGGQVTSGSLSLTDSGALETKVQTLERE
jgi:hypothetical protein